MKRELHFIVQAKGGVGKSLHTYLRALSEASRLSLFVDLDSSTKTSSRQLAFLGPDRFEAFSLLDNRERLMRDLFIGYVESLSGSPFEKVFLDFGAPESEQLPALITRDIDLKEWCDELGMTAVFHIIIGGGGAYLASIQFLEKMRAALNSRFQMVIWQNLFGFAQFPALSRELEENCSVLGLDLRRFGDFEPASLLGGQILDGIRNGYALKDYPPGARLRLKKELRENFSDE
ncbi:MAG: hypothetical protein BGO21_14050 [Dyadobacter sp. 50-39]|uniref:hypothetical protein n=1 Tax=Dyadobacter sp. 50-39 TaxID=1895756 RepID=UPI00095B20BF|nr:hypothetical protein [Dyadobacter sp. 50-39]OJV22389.1 MAG: hypothetical protein BGO21_14050 [Dyadobacter sp. 50-39]